MSGYIHSSRITNNIIKDTDTVNLTPESSTAIDPDPVEKESIKSSNGDLHSSTSQLNSNATSLNQTNQEPVTVKNETTISEEDASSSAFRTDLYKDAHEDPEKDHTTLNDNAINLFAQRISHVR